MTLIQLTFCSLRVLYIVVSGTAENRREVLYGCGDCLDMLFKLADRNHQLVPSCAKNSFTSTPEGGPSRSSSPSLWSFSNGRSTILTTEFLLLP